MPIIDPPDYVAIDPVLIYETHDIPPILYQRLLQLVGWMWVTKKSGKDLGLTIEDLAERWRVSERSVYHSLQTLGERGYITIHYARGRVYVRRGPRITDSTYTPGEPATQHAARGGTHTTDSTHNRPREAATEHKVCATPLHENGTNSPPCATPLHEGTNSNVVDVVSTFSGDQEQQHQHTNNDAVQSACTASGLWPDMASELEADSWITPERILGWYEHLTEMQERGECIGGRPIGSVQALMMTNLRAHREPPEKKQEAVWRPYISGEYAEFIQH